MKQDHEAPHSRRSRRHPRPRTAPPRPVSTGRFIARALLVGLLMVTALTFTTGAPAMAQQATATPTCQKPSKPGVPTVAQASSNPHSALDVSWTKTGQNPITSYDVRWGQNGSFTGYTTLNDGKATSYTITGLTASQTYDVQLKATFRQGSCSESSDWSGSGTGTTAAAPTPTPTPTATPVPNRAPSFTDNNPTTRHVDEGSAVGTNVGAPVAATDPDGDTLTYLLTDESGKFTIDGATGQIKVNGSLDHNTKSGYHVRVTVEDPDKASDRINVRISVNKAPTPTPATHEHARAHGHPHGHRHPHRDGHRHTHRDHHGHPAPTNTPAPRFWLDPDPSTESHVFTDSKATGASTPSGESLISTV